MKNIKNVFLLLVFILIGSCSSKDIQISTDLDHGSLGEIKEIEPGYFQGSTKHWLKRDSIGDQYYWFYFKADHVKDKQITFELNDLVGVYRRNPHVVYTGYTQPVYSYDQETWQRIENVKYDSASHAFWFSQRFDEEPVWIAYAHPYSYHRLQHYISSLRENSFVQVEEVAKTNEGRGIDLVTITDAAVDNRDKKTIFLMAMQHAGEDAGTYLLEGLVNYLVSENKFASIARERFIYKVILMMNPDGVYNGITRYNTTMEDLNNIWLDDNKMQPEVQGVKDWVKGWTGQGNKIDLFLDVHNHTQLYTYHVFIFMDNALDDLVPAMNRYWPARIWHSEFEGSSCAYFYGEGVPCGTIELSQSFAEVGSYLNIDDYHGYGEGVVRGFIDFFEE